MRVACDSMCPGRPVAQWGIVFGVSGALHGVRDIAAALENLPGLHPALGHVSLFEGNWRLPAILQQWAAHMAIYQVSGGHSIQVYSGGGGRYTPARGGGLRDVGAPVRLQLCACGLQGGVQQLHLLRCGYYRPLGRSLRRSTVLELPSKATQAILRRPESTVDLRGLGTPGPTAAETSRSPRGTESFQAVTSNLRRGLAGKVQALGSCLRGWVYRDLVGL